MQTWEWWDQRRVDYQLIVSSVVESECEQGDRTVASRRLGFMAEATRIVTDDETIALAKTLVGPGRIPASVEADAIHIAAAVLSNCEYLLTWNFRHLVNAQIRREVERILRSYGHPEILICTPEELRYGSPMA